MAKNEIKINGKNYSFENGETVLEIARRNKIDIPTLCYHSDYKPEANCRLCLVEIGSGREAKIVTSCSTKAVSDLEIKTDTAKVKKIRKINMEMLFSDHAQKCNACDWRYNCQLKKLAADFGLENSRFDLRRRKFKIDKATPSILWDSSKCVECSGCKSTCDQITGLNIIEPRYRGSSIIFAPRGGKSFADTNCIYCGQCVVHCPAGSLQEADDLTEVKKILSGKKKGEILIAQFAPSVRFSIGELFNQKPGENLEKKVVSGLKKLGFDYVFDVNLGADITTIEEAAELKERIESGKNMPMFTSCCPAWVRYIEIFQHDLIPNLTSTKSPNQILSVVVKGYFAKKIGVSPRKIKIVSIMPCVAKKYESGLKELRISGINPCDKVLTVRELGRLLKEKDIDLLKLADEDFDCTLGNSTGAAMIYGASGGVMESALRTMIESSGDDKLDKLNFKAVRGLSGLKETSVTLKNGKILELAVVSGMKNAIKLIQDIRSGVKHYDYIEVMACPGGCLGGGGQPMPVDNQIREARRAGFYIEDEKKVVRRAHENKEVLSIYSSMNLIPNSGRSKKLFHRRFVKRRKKE